jgi:chromosome segregation ATPase
MKLLPKSELIQSVALDKKLNIDQGLSLARKIDKLRQTVSEEELVLSKFRLGTGKILLEEINELIRERDALKEEIKDLNIQKESAKESLDEEWETLKEKREELKLQEEDLTQKKLTLEQSHAEYQENLKKITDKENEVRELIKDNESKDRKLQERESKLLVYKQNLTEGINNLK